jgi:hypothetical protein
VRDGKITIPHQGEPAAPIRCYLYSEAGSNSEKFLDSPLFKFTGTNKGASDRLFDNMMILADEAHLMMEPGINTAFDNKVSIDNVKNLRRRIYHAKNAKVGLFTATPVVQGGSVDEGRAIMDVVKGIENKDRSDEGFISYFMSRPPLMFATALGLTGAQLPQEEPVVLEGECLDNYLKKRFKTPPKPKKVKGKKSDPPQGLAVEAKLPPLQEKKELLASLQKQEYYNAGVHTLKQAPKEFLKTFSKGGVKNMAFKSSAPKLFAMAEFIQQRNLKTAVLIDGQNGLQYLAEELRGRGVKVTECYQTSDPAEKKADSRKIDAFNKHANIKGEKSQVILLDTRQYSEGISLNGVRLMILGDLSMGVHRGSKAKEQAIPNWGRMKQKLGRALRACSHTYLDPSERTLDIHLFVAKLPEGPQYKGHRTFDEEKHDIVAREAVTVEARMCVLAQNSIDAELYGWDCAKDCKGMPVICKV